MTHGLRIKDGQATYVSRYVKTSRLKQEEYFGGAKFMKVGGELHKSSVLGIRIHLSRISLLWSLITFLVNTF